MILRGLKLQEAIQLAAEGDARGKSVRSCGMSGMRRVSAASRQSGPFCLLRAAEGQSTLAAVEQWRLKETGAARKRRVLCVRRGCWRRFSLFQ